MQRWVKILESSFINLLSCSSFNKLSTIKCIKILMGNNLEYSSRSLTSNDGRVSKEELVLIWKNYFPDTEPTNTVFLNNLVLVDHPVLIPSKDGGRVVHSQVFYGFDFKVCTFHLFHYPVERHGCICSRKDILCHKELFVRKKDLLPIGDLRIAMHDEDQRFAKRRGHHLLASP
jgi:hypothetical protein